MTPNRAVEAFLAQEATERAPPSAARHKEPFSAASAVVSEARSWIGTPYAHGQSLKGIGSDCIGLIGGVAIARKFASGRGWMADQACKGYGRDPDELMLLEACHRHLIWLPANNGEPGDIYLMRAWDGPARRFSYPRHFGIIVAPGRIVHAYALLRRVVETPIDTVFVHGVLWRRLIVSAWRYREVQAARLPL